MEAHDERFDKTDDDPVLRIELLESDVELILTLLRKGTPYEQGLADFIENHFEEVE
jgi:hypothetical protein